MTPSLKADLKNLKASLINIRNDINSAVVLLGDKELEINKTLEKLEIVSLGVGVDDVFRSNETAVEPNNTSFGTEVRTDVEITDIANVHTNKIYNPNIKPNDGPGFPKSQFGGYTVTSGTSSLVTTLIQNKEENNENTNNFKVTPGKSPSNPLVIHKSSYKSPLSVHCSSVSSPTIYINPLLSPQSQKGDESITKECVDNEEAVSDADSVVSVRPCVKRNAGNKKSSRTSNVKAIEKNNAVLVNKEMLTKTVHAQDKFKIPNTVMENKADTEYVDYNDPEEELFLWDMPHENSKGFRRDPVEITSLVNLYLLGPGARGMERISTRAGVALKMRVQKGRDGVLIYGIPQGIEKAKQMIRQVDSISIQLSEDEACSLLGRQSVRSQMISRTAGVVLQVVGNKDHVRRVELVGLPAGLTKAKEMLNQLLNK